MNDAASTKVQRGNSHEEAEQGFTLIELMIVVVIIGILQSACAGTGIPDATTWNDTAGAPQWTVFAVGNADSDPDLDQWSISTGARTFPAAATATCMQTGNVAGGEPANDHNDV